MVAVFLDITYYQKKFYYRKGGYPYYGGFWLGYETSTGKVQAWVSNVYSDVLVTNNVLPLNVLNQICLKCDGTNLSIYINGVIASSTKVIGVIPNVIKPVQISYTTGTEWIKGTFKAVRYYNRALTDAEILQNYNASR